MLRPEQLMITPCQNEESAVTILDVDFSGHLSTLTLAIAQQTLTLKTVSRADWTPGRRVHIEVSGKGRVFIP
jgi:iron(III) transport system ATP-binding protein